MHILSPSTSHWKVPTHLAMNESNSEVETSVKTGISMSGAIIFIALPLSHT